MKWLGPALLSFLCLAGGRVEREVVIDGCRFPNSIVLLIDASGSMSEDKGTPYALAIHEAMRVAMQATDDARVKFYAFGNAVDAEPQGWIKLPNLVALQKARGWLQEHGADGNTNLTHAMKVVLALPDNPLGIIVVTDEDPDGGTSQVAKQIFSINQARESPAIIGVIGILPTKSELGNLIGLTGGYTKVSVSK